MHRQAQGLTKDCVLGSVLLSFLVSSTGDPSVWKIPAYTVIWWAQSCIWIILTYWHTMIYSVNLHNSWHLSAYTVLTIPRHENYLTYWWLLEIFIHKLNYLAYFFFSNSWYIHSSVYRIKGLVVNPEPKWIKDKIVISVHKITYFVDKSTKKCCVPLCGFVIELMQFCGIESCCAWK